jgi:hypothetical protein
VAAGIGTVPQSAAGSWTREMSGGRRAAMSRIVMLGKECRVRGTHKTQEQTRSSITRRFCSE